MIEGLLQIPHEKKIMEEEQKIDVLWIEEEKESLLLEKDYKAIETYDTQEQHLNKIALQNNQVWAEKIRLGILKENPLQKSEIQENTQQKNAPAFDAFGAYTDEKKKKKLKSRLKSNLKKANKQKIPGATGETLSLMEEVKKYNIDTSESKYDPGDPSEFSRRKFDVNLFEPVPYRENRDTTLDVQKIKRQIDMIKDTLEEYGKLNDDKKKNVSYEIQARMKVLAHIGSATDNALRTVLAAQGVDYMTGGAVSAEVQKIAMEDKNEAIEAYKQVAESRFSLVVDEYSRLIGDKWDIAIEERFKHFKENNEELAEISKNLPFTFTYKEGAEGYAKMRELLDANPEKYKDNKEVIDKLWKEFLDSHRELNDITTTGRALDMLAGLSDEGVIVIKQEDGILRHDPDAQIRDTLVDRRNSIEKTELVKIRLADLTGALNVILNDNAKITDPDVHIMLEKEFGYVSEARFKQQEKFTEEFKKEYEEMFSERNRILTAPKEKLSKFATDKTAKMAVTVLDSQREMKLSLRYFAEKSKEWKRKPENAKKNVDDRIIFAMISGYNYGDDGLPLSPEDDYKRLKDMQVIDDYFSGNQELKDKLIDGVIDTVINLKLSPDLLEKTDFTQDFGKWLQYSRCVTLIQNIKKENPEYFKQDNYRIEMLNEADLLATQVATFINNVININGISLIETGDIINSSASESAIETFKMQNNMLNDFYKEQIKDSAKKASQASIMLDRFEHKKHSRQYATEKYNEWKQKYYPNEISPPIDSRMFRELVKGYRAYENGEPINEEEAKLRDLDRKYVDDYLTENYDVRGAWVENYMNEVLAFEPPATFELFDEELTKNPVYWCEFRQKLQCFDNIKKENPEYFKKFPEKEERYNRIKGLMGAVSQYSAVKDQSLGLKSEFMHLNDIFIDEKQTKSFLKDFSPEEQKAFYKESYEKQYEIYKTTPALVFEKGVDADEYYRSKTEQWWRELSPEQKNAAYEYTHFSNHINWHLRGFENNWYNSVGIGNTKPTPEVVEQVKHLEEAISKSKLDEDVMLLRGSDTNRLGIFLGKLPQGTKSTKDSVTPDMVEELNRQFKGAMIKEPGFLSTSTSNDAGLANIYQVKYHIKAKKGTQAIYCEPFSHFSEYIRKKGAGSDKIWDGKGKLTDDEGNVVVGNEVEILLQRNTKFLFNKIEYINDTDTNISSYGGIFHVHLETMADKEVPKEETVKKDEEILNNFTESLKTDESKVRAFKTRVDADKAYRPKAYDWHYELSEEQKNSLLDYTLSSYQGINKHLRGLLTEDEKKNLDMEEVLKDIENIETALEQSVIEEDIMLRRGTTVEGFSKFFNIELDTKLKKGKDLDSLIPPEKLKEINKNYANQMFKDPAFMSTSIACEDASLAKMYNVQYHITALKGTKGAYLEPFSAYGANTGVGQEVEMLLQKGTTLIFERIEYDEKARKYNAYFKTHVPKNITQGGEKQ